MERERIVSAFLLLVLAALLYVAARLLLPYAAPIAWAVILAVVFHPAYALIHRVCPRPKSLAAALMTLLVVVAVVVPSLLLSGVLAREAVTGYQRLAELSASGQILDFDWLAQSWAIAPVWEWARERMSSGEVDPTGFLLSGVRWLSEFAARSAADIARNVLQFLVGLGIMVFTLFFAFRDGASMLVRLEGTLPMDDADRRLLTERLRQTILAVVQGLTVTAAAQGLLVGLGLWAVGVPFAVLLATAAAILAFLPIGGAALVWIPVVAGIALSGDFLRAAILGVWCLLIVSSVDNVIRPVVIGAQARLSTPILLFGILGGIQAFGIIGLFVGPTVLAALSCFVGIYRERFLRIPAGDDA